MNIVLAKLMTILISEMDLRECNNHYISIVTNEGLLEDYRSLSCDAIVVSVSYSAINAIGKRFACEMTLNPTSGLYQCVSKQDLSSFVHSREWSFGDLFLVLRLMAVRSA